MTKNLEDVLGSEYAVAIKNEINQLKQSEKLLLGDILAVVERSDASLGRPDKDCEHSEKSKYIIVGPSKYSIICNKDIGSVRNSGSEWKIISLSTLVEQVLEFNFTYLQILFSTNVMYESAEFIRIRRVITELLKNDEHSKNVCFRKLVSLLTGVVGDINKDKFKDTNVLRNRVFLIYKVGTICDKFIQTGDIEITSELDVEQYELFVNDWTEGGVVHEPLKKCLNNTLKEYIDYEHEHLEEKSKGEIKTVILMRELEILKDLTLRTLEDN